MNCRYRLEILYIDRTSKHLDGYMLSLIVHQIDVQNDIDFIDRKVTYSSVDLRLTCRSIHMPLDYCLYPDYYMFHN